MGRLPARAAKLQATKEMQTRLADERAFARRIVCHRQAGCADGEDARCEQCCRTLCLACHPPQPLLSEGVCDAVCRRARASLNGTLKLWRP